MNTSQWQIHVLRIIIDIPVGVNPTDIGFTLDPNAIIVANSDSDGISVIDKIVE